MSYRPKSAPVQMGEASASKNRRKQNAEIDRVNKIHAAKLAAIKNEAPAKYHAPNGYYSIKGAKAPKYKADKVEGIDPDAPEVAHGLAGNIPCEGRWPPRPKSTPKILREKENERIAGENQKQIRAFDDKYKVNPDSFLVKNDLGKGKDCRPQWKIRTGLYDTDQARAGPALKDTNKITAVRDFGASLH